MVHDGADIIDIGGQSTRPGSQPVVTNTAIILILSMVGRYDVLFNGS